MTREDTAKPALLRAIGPFQLTLYGLGSMLGAGIYGLVGQAAGQLGSAIWLAFLVSMIAALFTGLSYASLASRYPRAGGAAYVTHRAYGKPLLSYLVGLAVVCSGLTSIATQSNVVAANLRALFGWESAPDGMLAVGFLLILAGVLVRGIRESLWFNLVCTAVEASGLLLVIAVGIDHWGSVSLLELPPHDGATALIVMQGSLLTFFAFIGFEDMLNVSEEVENPRRNMPLGMISAMLIATAIYMAVAVTAVSVVPWRELAAAAAPLTEVVARAAPWFPAAGFTVVTIFAVANTALVNYLMASRMLYGMSHQGLMPRALGAVHAGRQTPHMAIAVLFVVVAALALVGDIKALASATVLLLLSVFVVVNLALAILKRRAGEPRGAFEVPLAIPVLGALVCLSLIAVRVGEGSWLAPAIAGGLLVLIGGLCCPPALAGPTGSPGSYGPTKPPAQTSPRLDGQVPGQQQRRHAQPVRAHEQQQAGQGGANRDTVGMAGHQGRRHQPVHRRCGDGTGPARQRRGEVRGNGRSKQPGRERQRMAQRPAGPVQPGPFRQMIPEAGLGRELLQQFMQVDEFAQPLGQITVLEQVQRGMHHHVGWIRCPGGPAEHVDGDRVAQQRRHIRADAAGGRQDCVVHVHHRRPVAVPQRRQLVHPLPVVALVVVVQLHALPSRRPQRLLDRRQSVAGHEDVDVGRDPAAGHTQIKQRVGGALQEHDGRIHSAERVQDHECLGPQILAIVGAQPRNGGELPPHRRRQRFDARIGCPLRQLTHQGARPCPLHDIGPLGCRQPGHGRRLAQAAEQDAGRHRVTCSSRATADAVSG